MNTKKLEAVRNLLSRALAMVDEVAKADARGSGTKNGSPAAQQAVRTAVTALQTKLGLEALDLAAVVLSFRAGVDSKTVSRWISGESYPRRGTVAKVNAALESMGVDPIELA